MVGREGFEAFEQNAVDPIGNIADVSIYEYDKRDERSFEFLNIFVENGLERTKLAQLHRGVRRRHRDGHRRHGGGDGVADDDGAVPAAAAGSAQRFQLVKIH